MNTISTAQAERNVVFKMPLGNSEFINSVCDRLPPYTKALMAMALKHEVITEEHYFITLPPVSSNAIMMLADGVRSIRAYSDESVKAMSDLFDILAMYRVESEDPRRELYDMSFVSNEDNDLSIFYDNTDDQPDFRGNNTQEFIAL